MLKVEQFDEQFLVLSIVRSGNSGYSFERPERRPAGDWLHSFSMITGRCEVFQQCVKNP